MKKEPSVVTFGEIMLRLNPTGKNDRLIKTDTLKMGYAGAESNVAIAMAQWNNDVSFVTVLPDNALGDGANNLLREFGVNTKSVVRSGERIGIYFIENGASIRPSKVTYDRDHSAIKNMQEGLLDWEEILKGKDVLHLTGITPALSDACANEAIKAASVAKSLGVLVSFDLNFRRTLWKSREKAKLIFDQILNFTDILIANEGSVKDVYDMDSSHELSRDRCKELMPLLCKKFKVMYVAFTERMHLSASQNLWSGLLFDGTNFHESPDYDLQIVDRFGGGDAFAAGLLHGVLRAWDAKKIVEFATAASALQQTIPGDLSLLREAEVDTIMNGHISGHVER